MSIARTIKDSTAKVAVSIAGAASLSLNLFGAFRTNAIKNKLTADNIETVKHDLNTNTQVLGIGGAALVILTAIPDCWQSFLHRSEGSLATVRYYTEQWDYVLGRLLQAGALTLSGIGAKEVGADNPQNATALFAVGGFALHAGNMLTMRHKARMGEQKGEVQQQYAPLSGFASSASSEAPPPSYQRPGLGYGTGSGS